MRCTMGGHTASAVAYKRKKTVETTVLPRLQAPKFLTLQVRVALWATILRLRFYIDQALLL